MGRERGIRNNLTFVQEESQYRRGGLGRNQHSSMHIFQNDTLTAQNYAVDVLRSHIVLYDSFLLILDARPHTAQLGENMHETETIQRTAWSAYCPNLNMIEHVLDSH